MACPRTPFRELEWADTKEAFLKEIRETAPPMVTEAVTHYLLPKVEGRTVFMKDVAEKLGVSRQHVTNLCRHESVKEAAETILQTPRNK